MVAAGEIYQDALPFYTYAEAGAKGRGTDACAHHEAFVWAIFDPDFAADGIKKILFDLADEANLFGGAVNKTRAKERSEGVGGGKSDAERVINMRGERELGAKSVQESEFGGEIVGASVVGYAGGEVVELYADRKIFAQSSCVAEPDFLLIVGARAEMLQGEGESADFLERISGGEGIRA